MHQFTFKQETPESSNLARWWYDFPTRQLYVEFQNGTIAGYRNVPGEIANHFSVATSKGRFYNSYFRNNGGTYPGISVDAPPVEREKQMVVPHSEHIHVAHETKAAPKARAYTVRGVALVEENYVATSIEEAVELFLDDYVGAKVNEVVVSFD